MNKLILIITGVCTYVTCSVLWASTLYGNLNLSESPANPNQFTVLNAEEYQQIVAASRAKIQQLITELGPYRRQAMNSVVAYIAQQLQDIPYGIEGATGEGDWQPSALTYQPGAVHVQQDPLYRLDILDCQTFVEVAMALLYANDLASFDTQFVKISYGAAGNPANEYVHYYNRNSFVDGDFNPINERAGKLIDSTSGRFAAFVKYQSVVLTRQNWFLYQQQRLADTVRVLAEKNGPAMVQRFTTVYSALNFPNFASENISISYLPKELIALPQANGTYKPNDKILKRILVPAVVEIIRDPNKWKLGDKLVKDVIGSELTVSHMGLLYRQVFSLNQIIYQKISCNKVNDKKVCSVTPVRCEQSICMRLMMAHASERYPNGYYWYADANGNYTCTDQAPPSNQAKVFCNRVESVPLYDYLTDYQYGGYRYMENSSILGVHVESLN